MCSFDRLALNALFVSMALIPGTCFAAVIGSGSISGTFVDDVATASPPLVLPFNAPLPRSSLGSGTSVYQWGLQNSDSRYFLDGVETPLADINALGLSLDEFNARVTRERLISDNLLSFSSTGFSNQPKGEIFVAGLLEYSNGVSASGTAVPSVTLTLNSSSSDPDFEQVLDVHIGVISTTNVRNANGVIIDIPSADFIFFQDHPEFGSFRVFENQSTSVEVLAEFNSLDLMGFGAVTDPAVGFVSPSIGPLSLPEPTTTALLGLGLLGLAWRRRVH